MVPQQALIIILQCIIHHGFTQNAPTISSSDQSAVANRTKCENAGLTLNLRDVGLKRVDSDFVNGPNVTCLDLEANEIAYVAPTALRSLPNLAYLNLAKNKLSLTNFSELDGHYNLRTLILDENAEDEKTNPTLEFKNEFRKLSHLHLRNNNLNDITSLKFAPRLTHLYLSSNNFADSELSFLNESYSLVVLDLANCSIGHANISNLQRLQEIRLDDNRIQRICGKCHDDSALVIEGLVSLKRLSITRNELNSIEPDSFDDSDNLEELDLSHNRIDSIRKGTLEKAGSLINLTLNDNLLTEMPDLCGPEGLQHLNLSNNQLKALKNDSFCMIGTLKTIDLSNNMIWMIETGAFASQERLENLNLANNRLTSFPNYWLRRMFNLKVLQVNGNQLKNLCDLRLSDLITSKLERVDLRNNSIRVFHTRSFYHSLRSEQNAPNIILEISNKYSVSNECKKCECNNEDQVIDF